MSLCNIKTKFTKHLNVLLDIEPKSFTITAHKKEIKQTASIDVSLETTVPEPVVFKPLSPTKYSTQIISGLRPSTQFLVEINGTTFEVKYSGKEFSKVVNLEEGINDFEIRLIKNHDHGNYVFIKIEKNTEPPTTSLFANHSIVTSRAITNGSFDVLFVTSEKTGPATTYYRINDGIVQVFSGSFILSTEGDYRIEFWSNDSLDNEETPHNFVDLIIDRTPPTRPTININDLPIKTNLNYVTVTGTNSSDTFIIEVNGVIGVIADSTDWSAVIPLTVEGPNIITAIAYDEAGNASDPAEVSIILDQIPPTQPQLIQPQLISSVFRTNLVNLLLIGSQSEDTISMLLNGEENRIRLTSFIRWAVTVDLVEGPNDFKIEALDDVGNISQPLVFTIILDTIPPPPPTIDPVISPTNQANQLLMGTTSLDTATIYVNNDPFLAEISNGIWRAFYQLTIEGLNTIIVKAADSLGNISLPASVGVILDQVPPLPPTIDPIPAFTNQGVLLLAGDKSEDSLEISINNDTTGVTFPSPTRWQKTINLIFGINTFEVAAFDEVGNMNSVVEAETEYKISRPLLTIDPYPSTVISSFSTITGTREISSAVAAQEIGINIYYPDGQIGGIKWQATLNLLVGTNSFIFNAKDRAGNESLPVGVSIDRVLPVEISAFTINTVYAYGSQSQNRVFVDGQPLPILVSNNIRSLFVQGIKPVETTVVSNLSQVEMPDGVSGKTWQMFIPVFLLTGSVLEITLQGNLVVDPPKLFISKIVIAKNIFAGTISTLIGGTTLVSIEQNASIVMTDQQYLNTPSPIVGVPLNQILEINYAVSL